MNDAPVKKLNKIKDLRPKNKLVDAETRSSKGFAYNAGEWQGDTLPKEELVFK